MVEHRVLVEPSNKFVAGSFDLILPSGDVTPVLQTVPSFTFCDMHTFTKQRHILRAIALHELSVPIYLGR